MLRSQDVSLAIHNYLPSQSHTLAHRRLFIYPYTYPNEGRQHMPEQGELKQVTVTRGASNPQDEIATRNLLNSTLVGDKYECPRCDYSTQNPEEMIEHLAMEINKSIQEVSSLAKPSPKLKR